MLDEFIKKSITKKLQITNPAWAGSVIIFVLPLGG